MEFLVLVLLAVVGVILILPIVAVAMAVRTRSRLTGLERAIREGNAELDRLSSTLLQLHRDLARGEARASGAAAPAASPEPVPALEAAETTEVSQPARSQEPWLEAGAVEDWIEGAAEAEPIPVPVAAPETAASSDIPAAPEDGPAAPEPFAAEVPPAALPEQPAPEHRSPPAAGALPPSVGFDWEGLVGVKLFSAIAGIALVFAAVFFLRFSIEQGWLQPPIRIAIGIIVAVGLLLVCELKAARNYPATANALDAAAIAILFATFFAAHALWNLIPGAITFVLLALVTAVAVLLSIRRDSLFISVLGLLGGFATPILLSTGENQPIPLFGYLLLLNIGLAWVAYRKRWPILMWLTLVLTTFYQWGWVFRFLDAASVSLAMAIFLMFPLAAVGGLMIGRRERDGRESDGGSFERTALISAVLPAFFAVYLAAVPEYGARPGLLFGFVLLVDAGLLAVAVARREPLLHRTGAAATVLTLAIWLAVSYPLAGGWPVVLPFTAAFVIFYLLAPLVAARFPGPTGHVVERTAITAPVLLFVFPVLALIEPAFRAPLPLFATLLGLVILIAWRAITAPHGTLYYIAAFFAVAAQAMWSAVHLTIEVLPTAVLFYTAFGVAALGVPVAARRFARPLAPVWGGGAVLLASLGLLFFISAGPVAPATLWALALLLAILNAALFIESAAGRLPLVSQAGSLLSWLILGTWWERAAATVGVLPSLTVLTGLTLITLAGHAWAARVRDSETRQAPPGFVDGSYLALIGHLFLVFLASNREWAIPPLPLFGSLAVITLATSAASLYVRSGALHAGGTIAAAVVIAVWALSAGAPPYGLVATAAAAIASGFALAWIRLAPGHDASAARAAAAVSFIGALTAVLAVRGGASPPFAAVLIGHVAHAAVLLALAWAYRWKYVGVAAIAPAWIAVLQWQALVDPATGWRQLLLLSGAIYALFVGYPLILGSRAAGEREPYVGAVAASVMFFFAARAAFIMAGLGWMIGVVPIAIGAVLAGLLRALLTIEPAGARDTGRLALVAGAALAFVTVAIPLQLRQQWITIGWALEGAALAWLYRRVTHKGLLHFAVALMATVFVRLVLNPDVFFYEPRGSLRVLNWYLYTYLLCAAAVAIAGWWLSKTEDRLPGGLPRASRLLPAAAAILAFMLLNIEIADFYATGPSIVFRFGESVSQDLTYTIAWLAFGMALLAAGIYAASRPARIAAVALIAVTTFKCFLYDLGSLEGLHRVGSFVGLALSLALVSLALQKYVLSKPRETA